MEHVDGIQRQQKAKGNKKQQQNKTYFPVFAEFARKRNKNTNI